MRARGRSIRRMLIASGVTATLILLGSPPASAQSVTWTTQFGTPNYEWVEDVALTAGIAYAAGVAHSRLPGSDTNGEIFVRAVSAADGSLIWSRQFGDGNDLMDVHGVAADATGVYVVGSLYNALLGQTSAGRRDAFVRKYDLAGDVVWTRQFGTTRIDAARNVALGGGALYVAGTTNDGLGGRNAGLDDVFVRAYDLAGNELWTTQFGTPDWDLPTGIAADAGAAYVVGITEGSFAWQSTPTSGSQGFVVKLGPNGGERWHRRIDGPGFDTARAAALDGGQLTVVGNASGMAGQRLFGSDSNFVRRYGSGGKVVWTRTFGSWYGEFPSDVAVDASGTFVVGSTYGTFPGATNRGHSDAFVVALDPAGSLAWVDEFGSRDTDSLNGAAVEAGTLVVGGETWGAIDGLSRGVDDALLRGYAV